MNLGIIGCGAIGTDVALAADKIKEIKKIYLHDIKKKASDNLCKKTKKAEIMKVKDFLPHVDIVFEGASQEAVYEYAEQVLTAGKDLILMSVGSLFDDNFRKKIERIAKDKNCKIHVPSGAICGIDGILSANISKLDEVTLVTTKPPESFNKTFGVRSVLFPRLLPARFVFRLQIARRWFHPTIDPRNARHSYTNLDRKRFSKQLRLQIGREVQKAIPGSYRLRQHFCQPKV